MRRVEYIFLLRIHLKGKNVTQVQQIILKQYEDKVTRFYLSNDINKSTKIKMILILVLLGILFFILVKSVNSKSVKIGKTNKIRRGRKSIKK